MRASTKFTPQAVTRMRTCPAPSGAEGCSLTVPAGNTSAYLMIKGYTASTFKLALNYTKGASGGATPPATPAPSGTAKTSATDGTVAAGKTVSYNAITVLAGTTFSVAMTGTGDADLYVRFGAAPTASLYNCRPYMDGSVETCSLPVPAGETKAYVMVSGYATATYHLDFSYTAP